MRGITRQECFHNTHSNPSPLPPIPHTYSHAHLEAVQNGRVALPAQRAQHEAPALRSSCSLHCCLPGSTHACT
eukprot:1141205-Pelagomonas_calceolata.AAC.3